MTPKEIVSMILVYESEIIDLHEKAEYEIEYDYYEERIDDLIKKQVGLIENFKKEICLDIASKAWLQSLKKANDPMKEKAFKIENCKCLKPPSLNKDDIIITICGECHKIVTK